MIVILAEIYGEDMTETRLDAYLKIIDHLTIKDCERAFIVITKNPDIKRMPLPAQILEAARPKLNSREEAIRRLAKIKEAIRKFGWPSPNDAKKFLGELIWNDVMRMGGWKHMCESPDANINDTTVYAQLRDGLTSSVQAERSGIDYEAPALPGAENKVLELIQETSNKKQMEGSVGKDN